MKKIFSILTVALLTATASMAQSTWTVDKAHSKLSFSITHLLISDVEGSFKTFQATITSAKPDFSDATFEMTADAASVNTDNEKRDGHLKSPDFFDVEKFPTLTFRSTGITKVSDKRFKLTGNLTLHGVTKPVSLDLIHKGSATGQGGKQIAGFKITGTIKRSDFNFGSKFGGATLSDEVEIAANGEFGKN